MPGRSPGPSVKDPEQYEALRRQGESKEKAARIANASAAASRSKVAASGGKAGSYDDWTKERLYRRAQEIGIDGRSKMSNEALIEALRNH